MPPDSGRPRLCPICRKVLAPSQRTACSPEHAQQVRRGDARIAQAARDPRYLLALLKHEHPEHALKLHLASELNDPRQLSLGLDGGAKERT
jgi:hypothetical protein